MISEGSSGTEDWNNDAGNTAFITGINYILKYNKAENHYFKLQIHSIILVFFCIFDQINAALMSRRDFI